ncbi:MAG TPA: hypothetical protein ENK46_01450 [Flavobacteriia bacterium]|jgi:hypothetical protein|nr:hypothetical protein [Flavobacteriia bacterium]
MKKNKLQHIKSQKGGFKTPEGYFDTVEDAVFAKITSEKFAEKEGFSTPSSYFDTVEDTILTKIKGEENQQSRQAALPNTTPTGYTIPENYLETVENTIVSKLNNKKASVKVIDFKTFILKRVIPLVAAASVLLFIGLHYNSKNKIKIEDVAASEIEQWIDEGLITLDTDEIAEAYSDVELEDTTTFDEEELLDYLNGTDVESLLLEN